MWGQGEQLALIVPIERLRKKVRCIVSLLSDAASSKQRPDTSAHPSFDGNNKVIILRRRSTRVETKLGYALVRDRGTTITAPSVTSLRLRSNQTMVKFAVAGLSWRDSDEVVVGEGQEGGCICSPQLRTTGGLTTLYQQMLDW